MADKKKQTVIKVDINCADCQKEIFASVGKIKGVSSLVVDAEKKTVTVVGSVEPSPIFRALKKIKKNPEILSVGPPKPKCRYCKYFVCACGIARFPAKQPTELAPMPPGWREPQSCTEDGGCCPPSPYVPGGGWCPAPYTPARDWRCPPTPYNDWCPQPGTPYPYYLPPSDCHLPSHCDLVTVFPPPSPDRPGGCSIV
ncbi:hypothetical protein V2J09_009735 [Rumex salicifolius]